MDWLHRHLGPERRCRHPDRRGQPSGHLVDTYCNDNSTAPSLVNFYGTQYANATEDNNAEWYDFMLDGNKYYNVYSEGIYIGYRYYETRYEDAVLGQGNAGDYDYNANVAYPFGYGLSYTHLRLVQL